MCLLLVLGLAIAVAYFYREIVVKGKRCTSKAKLHGKTVIVTGSNTGIGKTTALDLAKRGARVILACRSKQRGEAALEEIKRDSVDYSFFSMFCPGVQMQGRTADGLGLMFGVNHIGHFLLTNLLLEQLKACGPSRVVNVSSMAHYFGKIDFDCLNTHKALGLGTSFMEVLQYYSDSKLCNYLFTHELAKRLKGTNVTCYSLHPGAINSELARNINSTLQLFLKPLTAYFFKNTEQGCQTTLHCALQEGIEPFSGRFFSNCTVKEVSDKAKDDAASKKLWELSERLCGLA
uniref:Dehydrogenase/reductase SDR family member 13-like n=1 Tax=Pundamilia nyererei TaxID=303518 RepID=A0A3B4FG45_9CICH